MSQELPERAEALALLPAIRYGRVAMSKNALPFVTVARHVVDGGSVLLRIHRGFGYHSALDGNVAAYEAGNIESGASEVWSVQFVGEARLIEPTRAQLERFGPCTEVADGEKFDPVYLRLEPEFVNVHRLSGVPAPGRSHQHDQPAHSVQPAQSGQPRQPGDPAPPAQSQNADRTES